MALSKVKLAAKSLSYCPALFSSAWKSSLVSRIPSSCRSFATSRAASFSSSPWNNATAGKKEGGRAVRTPAPEIPVEEVVGDDVPTSGISRPLSEILKELNKRIPDSLVKVRTEANGFPVKYVPWHITNRIMNLHAPEWSGEVRSITYSADGNAVTVVYRVTIYGTDAEIYRESTGTAPVNVEGMYGDAIQTAEAMAFRRACARFGLGLHLYHEDML